MTLDPSKDEQGGATRPAGFFALRTALLPVARFSEWAAGADRPWIEGEEALARARGLLRERLRAQVQRPEVREALFLASPDLDAAFPHWLAEPDGDKGGRAERAIVRYFSRLCGRSTPFGLFGGSSVGLVGDRTRLETGPLQAYLRHTRLDNDYLTTLAETLSQAPEHVGQVVLRPNSSLYAGGGRLRYAESRTQGRSRSYHLVAVEETLFLRETLDRAREGASLEALARPLVAEDITLQEAEDYIRLLVASQILVADLAPPVTGPEPIHDLIRQLDALPLGGPVSATLKGVREALQGMDNEPLGIQTDRYRVLAGVLKALPAKVDLSRLFQVDMVKPAPGALLGPEVLREAGQVVELLRRLNHPSGRDPLASFRDDFTSRYEGEEVPLVHALDEESGIGFGKGATSGHGGAPLLDGLAFPGPEGAGPTPAWTPLQAFLLDQVLEARDAGRSIIHLEPADLEPFLKGGDRPLPGSFSLMARLAAVSQEALDQGRFKLVFQGFAGPSGVSLLGRFCHGDETLTGLVRAHLAEEEALRPEAVFAEVVHLPEGRIGNVILRPLVRGFEIPFLGRSGAPEDGQIPVDDLLVSVQGDQVILRSRRLGREVVPRLTNAHNFQNRSLGLYRFLCSLQFQGVAGGLGWHWGQLDAFPFLPRVEVGRTVLTAARWKVEGKSFQEVAKAEGLDRYRGLDAWREGLGIPRFGLLVEGDNKLPVDFLNLLSVDTFVDMVRNRPRFLLEECCPGPEEQAAVGPEGTFVHELVIPFLHSAPVAPAASRSRPPGLAGATRTFPPGGEWLYLKVYTGPATADQVLRDTVGPVVREALATGSANRWFFLRYGDPDWHVRLRFHGEPGRLLGELLPALTLALQPLLEQGQVRKLQLDTYVQELERYGEGPAMVLAERLFQADSEAALAILAAYPGDEGADARWRLALYGMDLLLDDAGLDLVRKKLLLGQTACAFRAEFRFKDGAERQLGTSFRKERRSLEAMLSRQASRDPALAEGLSILEDRSGITRPLMVQWRAGEPDLPPEVFGARLGSHLHMMANRLLRNSQRAQEMVIYDFLDRLYESRLARLR
jgi:thiopeptide-type bacteriocin biosynthesis protein